MSRDNATDRGHREKISIDEARRVGRRAALLRSQFSSGVSGQIQPRTRSRRPTLAAGRCTHATLGQRSARQTAADHERDKHQMEHNGRVGEKAKRH